MEEKQNHGCLLNLKNKPRQIRPCSQIFTFRITFVLSSEADQESRSGECAGMDLQSQDIHCFVSILFAYGVASARNAATLLPIHSALRWKERQQLTCGVQNKLTQVSLE